MILLIQKEKKGHVMPKADNNCSVEFEEQIHAQQKCCGKSKRKHQHTIQIVLFLIEYQYSLSSRNILRLAP